MNVDQWKSPLLAEIDVAEVALSDRDGAAMLGFPDGYSGNHGLASLETGTNGVLVAVRRLDSFELTSVGVMKIDVEGHEAAVLSGAVKLLGRKAIREIIFEEHGPYPAHSHQILLDYGYQIFRVTGSTFHPFLLPPHMEVRGPFLPPEYPPNYIATLDASRAISRFRATGWRSLTGGPGAHC
jgi:hypothetical protein